MKSELDRVASRMPMDTLSMKRYELPPPPAGKMTDVAAWNECVDNSLAQLEHQRTRIGKIFREIASFPILQGVRNAQRVTQYRNYSVVGKLLTFPLEIFDQNP